MITKSPGDCFSRCLCELSGEPYIVEFDSRPSGDAIYATSE